jgi:uncharacterized protein YbaR (Trm112 family)
MTIDPQLLEILACPACKGPLVLNSDPASLRCEQCRLSYRIEDDIPILLVDQATSYE